MPKPRQSLKTIQHTHAQWTLASIDALIGDLTAQRALVQQYIDADCKGHLPDLPLFQEHFDYYWQDVHGLRMLHRLLYQTEPFKGPNDELA